MATSPAFGSIQWNFRFMPALVTRGNEKLSNGKWFKVFLSCLLRVKARLSTEPFPAERHEFWPIAVMPTVECQRLDTHPTIDE